MPNQLTTELEIYEAATTLAKIFHANGWKVWISLEAGFRVPNIDELYATIVNKIDMLKNFDHPGSYTLGGRVFVSKHWDDERAYYMVGLHLLDVYEEEYGYNQ